MSRLVGARRKLVSSQTFLLLLLAGTLILNTNLSPYFWSPSNLSDTSSLYIELALITLPMTLLIVAGQIDLSVGSMVGLIGIVFGLMLNRGVQLPLAIPAALLVGAILGAVNGFIITRFRLSSLIVTLGSLVLYRGIAEGLVPNAALTHFPPSYTAVATTYVGPSLVTVPELIFLVLAVVFALVLHRSTLGRMVYAIGNNEQAARFSGIAVDRVKILLFALSGLVCAGAAVLLLSRLQAARNDSGAGFELAAITAVVLGGTDILGGRGTIVGTVVAMVVIVGLRNGMGLADVPDQAQLAAVGGLLVVSILATKGIDALNAVLARRSLSGGLERREMGQEA
jgi:rhamnose transport system permease protein